MWSSPGVCQHFKLVADVSCWALAGWMTPWQTSQQQFESLPLLHARLSPIRSLLDFGVWDVSSGILKVSWVLVSVAEKKHNLVLEPPLLTPCLYVVSWESGCSPMDVFHLMKKKKKACVCLLVFGGPALFTKAVSESVICSLLCIWCSTDKTVFNSTYCVNYLLPGIFFFFLKEA